MSLQSLTTSKIVTSNDGTEIYAEAQGNLSNPHLIFLHGLTSNASVFDALFAHPKLKEHFYMVRYESRGHGRSGKPSDAGAYTSEAYARDWGAVANAFKVIKPIHVGWSLGAALPADILTYLPPQTLAGIVNFSGIPYHGAILGEVITPILGSWAHGLSSTDALVALNTRLSIGPNLLYKWDTIPFEQQLQFHGSATILTPEASAHILSRKSDPTKLYQAGHPAGEDSGERPLPILYVYGANDQVIQTKHVAAELKAHFVDYTEVCLDECKHAVFLDQTEAVVQALVEFAGRCYA